MHVRRPTVLKAFSNPRLNPLPGIQDFKGEVVHPANWSEDTTVDGKRVALIGYGCKWRWAQSRMLVLKSYQAAVYK